MKALLKNNKTTFHFVTAVLASITAVLISGCATQSVQNGEAMFTDNQAIDQQKVCQDLEEIFKKSQHGFSGIRKKPVFYHKITLWQTDYQPLRGGCEIWQWSNRYSYVCSRVVPNEQIATQVFDESSRIVNQCLPENWNQQSVSLGQKGEKVQYSINGHVRGSLEKVNTGGLFSKDWIVYLFISSPEKKQ